jgi:hypothetical protein
LAPSANALTHAPSNATDAPTYAPSSLVEDGGMTAPTASSSSAATAAPVATSTAVAAPANDAHGDADTGGGNEDASI